MSLVTVYRVFRTRCHAVYERELSNMAVLRIENAGTQYIQWMLEVPTIFTKSVAPTLARELCDLAYDESLDNLIFVLEAYPASTHHGASPELGILVSINGSFKIGKQENQRNWKYQHCWIVDENGWTRWPINDLPKQVRHERDPKQTSPRVQRN